MNMVAVHGKQAIAHDGIEIARNGAVVQHGRRLYGGKFQINKNAVALLRPDARAAFVEREALLVVACNNLVQFGAGERKAMPGKACSSASTFTQPPG